MKFYKVIYDNTKRKKYAEGISLNLYQNQNDSSMSSCVECGSRDLFDEIEPITFVLSNDNIPDFVNVDVLFHLISSRAEEILKSEEITGYDITNDDIIVPANSLSSEILNQMKDYSGYNFVRKLSNLMPKLHRLHIKIGAELHEKSNVILMKKYDTCGVEIYVTKGESYIDPDTLIYINTKSWNGNDLFRVKGLGYSIYCTQRFVDVYNKYKLTGWIFEPVDSL